ncbi:hypothetical protein [Desulfobacca acetoxidans]|nr:hypothetical protein [Desulfobacca acetoxidans]
MGSTPAIKSPGYAALLGGALFLCFFPFLPEQGAATLSLSLFLTALLAALFLYPLLRGWVDGQVDLFHPISFAVLAYLFPNYVIKSLYLLFHGWPEGQSSCPLYLPQYQLMALLLVLLAYLALALGYWLRLGERLGQMLPAPPHFPLDPGESRGLLLALFLGGYLLIYVLAATWSGFYEREHETTWRQLSCIGYYCFFLMAFLYFRHPAAAPRLKLPLLFMAVITAAFLLTSGSRYALLMHIMYFLGAWQFARGRGLSRSTLLKALAVPIILLPLVLVISTNYRLVAYKNYGSRSHETASKRIDNFSEAIVKTLNSNVSENVDFAYEILINRLPGLDTLIVVLSAGPQAKALERAFGIDNNIPDDLFWMLVPRLFYPEKPIMMERGKYFGYIYWGQPLSIYSFPALTPIADLYRFGGVLALFVGMLVMGIFLKVVRTWLIGKEGQVGAYAALFYIYLITPLRGAFESSYTSLFFVTSRCLVVLYSFVLLIYLCYLLLNRPSVSSKKAIYRQPPA